MRVVALGSTFYFAFGSRGFSDGVPEAVAGTPDLSVIELDGTNAVIDTGATVAAHGSLTAVNIGTVAATTGNGYEAGKVYGVVIDTGTVDSVSVVGEVVYEFRIETAAELAAREYNEKLFPNHVIATTTSNDTTHINLAEIVDADTDDDEINGETLRVWDATDGQAILVRVTDYVKSTTLATVENLRGGVMPFTVAAGDMVWRESQYTAKNDALGAIPTAATLLTTQMTEAYHADGAAPTLAQALHFLIAVLTEFSVSGSTVTLKKLDGSTSAGTLTLDSATAPTSITRAT